MRFSEAKTVAFCFCRTRASSTKVIDVLYTLFMFRVRGGVRVRSWVRVSSEVRVRIRRVRVRG